MPGVDPKKLKEMQSVTQMIDAKIVVNMNKGHLVVDLTSGTPAAAQLIPEMTKNLATQFANQLQAFFAITGEIEVIE